LGTYNPIPNKENIKEIATNVERAKYWISVGAQCSRRVSWLFGKLGILPEPPRRPYVESAVPKALRKEEDAAKK
jgi:ribosomal protein S16